MHAVPGAGGWQASPYAIVLVLGAALSVAIALVVRRRRPTPGLTAFTLLMLAAGEWAAMAALEHSAVAAADKVFFARLEYLGIVSVAPLWLAFALAYSRQGAWLTPLRATVLWLVPLATLALAWTNDRHHLVWTAIVPSSPVPGAPLVYGHGAWFWLAAAYNYALNLAGTLTLLAAVVRFPARYRRQTAALLAGMAMPWIGNALYLARLWPLAGVDATPLAFTLTGAIYAVGVFGLGLFDLVPVARHRLIDSMPDGVLVLDLDNRVVDINPAARRLLGAGGASAVGERADSLLAAWPDLIDRYRDVRDEHTELRLEGRGGPHYLDLRITPLRDARGRFQGRLIVFSDVTARKRTEEALQQNEKLASLGQLLAGVAHELNNPLSVIVGHATLLLRGAPQGDGPAARVEKIAAAAERCGRIVRNFLAIARQRTTERTAGDLNRILRDAVDFLAYQLELDAVEVRLDLAAGLPPVWADAHQIQQVALNLITNAQHAMRARTGGRRLTIASWLARDRARLGFSVSDTGPGVPETLQHRIFEPFFTTKPVGMGSGLGLSVCRGIVAAHQGEIEVRPVPGGGAAFVVELPLSDGTPDGGPPAPAAAEPVAGRRILVVDDEPMVAELLAEILAEDGHQVEIATSGADALARLQHRRVDAVVSDVKMPGLDGPALYERLCLHDAGLRARFVFITGDTLSPDTRTFLEESGMPTLSKPFDADVVRAVVRDALRANPPPVY